MLFEQKLHLNKSNLEAEAQCSRNSGKQNSFIRRIALSKVLRSSLVKLSQGQMNLITPTCNFCVQE